MTITLTALQKQRRDTAANWTAENPTLLAGEIGIESDTGKIKIGTGAAAWNSLAYQGIIPSSGAYPLSQLIMPLGTAAAPAVTFTGDVNTGIYSSGADQVSFSTGGTERLRIDATGQIEAVSLGTAAAPTYTFTGDPNTGIYSPGADQLAISTGGSGRLFVDASGNVGLAVASPAASFDIQSSAARVARFGGPASAYIDVTDGTGNFRAQVASGVPFIGSSSNHAVVFMTNNSEKVRITSAGLVGVGTSSPGVTLDVVSESSAAIGLRVRGRSSDNISVIQFTNNAASAQTAAITATATSDLLFTPGSTERVRIDSSGRVGIGTSAPNTKTHLYDASNVALKIESGGANYVETNFINTSAAYTLGIRPDTSNSLCIRDNTATATRVVLDSSGRVGIGTTSPSEIIHARTTGSNAILLLNRSDPNTVGDLAIASASNTNYIQSQGVKDLVIQTNSTERARIDSSGRLLVGTSSSATVDTLVLQGNSDSIAGSAQLRLKRNATLTSGTGIGDISFGKASNTGAAIGAFADANWTDGTSHGTRLVFSTCPDGSASPSPRMTIKNDGNVLIATETFPTGTTEGFGFQAASKYLYFSRSGGAVANFNRYTSTGDVVVFRYADTSVGTISVTASATAYNTSSDYRLKENVTAVTDGISRLQQLKPSRFNFIADPSKTIDGFLAHEAAEVVPECVTGEKDAVDDEGNPIYQGIDQSKLVPLLTAALQEAIGEIESLKARLTAAGL